jgi:excisionase family DNA binding protein
MSDLENRVKRFNQKFYDCSKLPEQPYFMTMEISYLINDLWEEIMRLQVKQKQFEARIDMFTETNSLRILIGPNDLAKILGVPLSNIYQKTRKGSVYGIPVIRVGKYIRFRRNDVEKFVFSRMG